MENFSFKVAQNIIFGNGSLNKLPDIIKKEGKNSVFLVSDPGLDAVGIVDRVKKIIESANIEYSGFTDIKTNPTIDMVDECCKKYKASGASCIVALGGGSPMDVAKAVGILAEYGGDVNSYAGLNKVPGPIDPLIAIPTTAGTGSEVTASSVITDANTKFKMAVISDYIYPHYALLDPELIMTLPASVAAACGVDAFIHAMEAYVSKESNLFTDTIAEKAMEIIGANIRRFVASRNDAEAASNMMIGSTFAGVAFARALLGDIHAMSHPVSGFFGVPHGVANAILMPTIVEYNALSDNGRYRKIYDYICVGGKAGDDFKPQMLVDELRELNKSLGIPSLLSDVGVTEDCVHAMSIDAMKSGNIMRNPRQTTIKDVEALYRKLL